jgi:hypothetical protein
MQKRVGPHRSANVAEDEIEKLKLKKLGGKAGRAVLGHFGPPFSLLKPGNSQILCAHLKTESQIEFVKSRRRKLLAGIALSQKLGIRELLPGKWDSYAKTNSAI